MRRLIIIVCEVDESSRYKDGVRTNLFNSPFYEHAHRKIMDAANKLELNVKFVSADVFMRKTQNFDISATVESNDIVAVVSPFVFFAPSTAIESAIKQAVNNKFTYSTVGNADDYYAVFGLGEMILKGHDISTCTDFIASIEDTGAVYTHIKVLEKERATPQSRMEYFGKIEGYRKEFLDYLVMSGVDIENREGVIIAPNCVIRPGVKILPNTFIYDNSLIKENSVIGPNAVIVNSQIGEASVIENSKVSGSVLEYGVTVDSYSKIENNCQIDDGVKISSNCTIENSHIGARSVIYPNSVLVETKTGENTIIGSGTVTVKSVCSQTESKTYQTRIGDYAIIGCNSTLVAPIEIGDNGLVAAGSVITDTVPKNAFAIAREFQETKENRAKKRKRF